MQRIARVSTTNLVQDPGQPRKAFDEADLLALGQNMIANGQQVPVIVYQADGKAMLLDGERRWRAAQLVGVAELVAVVLPERPSLAQLRILQASLDVHKVSLSPMERSNLLAQIVDENGWGPTELAQRLSMRQPLVSKLLSFQKLAPAVQEVLHAGGIDMEKAFLISQESDLERQAELVKSSAHLTRDQVRANIRAENNRERPNVKRAAFILPGGLSVTLQGNAVTLEGAVQILTDTLRELKRGLAQGLDIATAQRVLRDKAKAGVS